MAVKIVRVLEHPLAGYAVPVGMLLAAVLVESQLGLKDLRKFTKSQDKVSCTGNHWHICARTTATYHVARLAIPVRVLIMVVELFIIVKELLAALAIRVARALGVVLLERPSGREILVALVTDVVHARVLLVLPQGMFGGEEPIATVAPSHRRRVLSLRLWDRVYCRR